MKEDLSQKTDYELLKIDQIYQSGKGDLSRHIAEDEFMKRYLPLLLDIVDHSFVEGQTKVPKVELILAGLQVLKDTADFYDPYNSGMFIWISTNIAEKISKRLQKD